MSDWEEAKTLLPEIKRASDDLTLTFARIEPTMPREVLSLIIPKRILRLASLVENLTVLTRRTYE